MQYQGGLGGTPHREGEGGAPSKQDHTPFMRGLIQEMGGSPQDLQRPHTSRQSGVEGAGEEGRESTGVGEGAPPPLGGRGTPEEQACVLFYNIVNAPLGRSQPNGQAPARHIR